MYAEIFNWSKSLTLEKIQSKLLISTHQEKNPVLYLYKEDVTGNWNAALFCKLDSNLIICGMMPSAFVIFNTFSVGCSTPNVDRQSERCWYGRS